MEGLYFFGTVPATPWLDLICLSFCSYRCVLEILLWWFFFLPCCQKVHEDAISFKHLLATFPEDCGAAASSDISPHLCFICLLHLANEHGLRIQGSTNLDDLSIHLPVSCQETGEYTYTSFCQLLDNSQFKWHYVLPNVKSDAWCSEWQLLDWQPGSLCTGPYCSLTCIIFFWPHSF